MDKKYILETLYNLQKDIITNFIHNLYTNL